MADLSPVMAEVLHNAGEVTFTITGNSMLPLLRHRKDKVCIVKPQENGLKKYDILLFVRNNGKYILHRIVAVTPEGYALAGDNQCVIEYPVHYAQVIGVVKGFWRGGKYFSCDSFWYRLYCKLWVFGYPVRWVYLRSKQFFGRTVKFLVCFAMEIKKHEG